MGASILIVEDEEPLTTLLRYNLEAEGYQVDAVARGDEADTRLRETAPDLIVLDWMLPGLSGIEVPPAANAAADAVSADYHATARGEESERVRGLPPAPTITWSSRFRCRNYWRGFARYCAERAPNASPPYWRSATSSSTANGSGCRARRVRSISGPPSFACSNS